MPTSRTRTRPPRGTPGEPPWLTTPELLEQVRKDAAHFPGGHALAVVEPRSEAEIAAVLRQARHVLPVGAQSSLTGGATPMGEVVLRTTRMNRILESGVAHVRVQAGVVLEALQAWLAEDERMFPPMPTFTGACAGGVVATNAAGAATFKYGTTRDWVLALSVVLPCGEVLDVVRGETVAQEGRFDIETATGSLVVPVPTYRMPQVRKCTAGYFARPEMDLIDLFIGSEGTLGVVSEITFKVRPRPPTVAWAIIQAPSERRAIECAAALRAAAQATWRTGDPRGIDVAAIELLDRRSLVLVREDGLAGRLPWRLDPAAEALLLVQLELSADTTGAGAQDQVARALDPDSPDTPLVRLCRLLAPLDLLDATDLVLPGDARRADAVAALREAVPAAVNRRIGLAQRTFGAGIRKMAGDVIVPFDRVSDLVALIHETFGRRELDYAVWGHLADAHLHPNVIPRRPEDVVAAGDAILELGRAVIRLGGSPLAEHGVGRNPIKQALLRDLYGDEGIQAMRRVKRAFDPEGKLAPGVLLPP